MKMSKYRMIGFAGIAVGLSAFAPLSAFAWAPTDEAVQSDTRVRYDGHVVVRAQIRSQADLRTMNTLSPDVWSHGVGLGPVDYRIPPENMDGLRASDISFEILIDDVQALIDAERSGGGVGADGWYDDYQNLDAVFAKMDDLAAANPEFVEVIEIGRSLENRPIKALHISKAAPDAPSVVYNHLQHAREWITVMAAMWTADELVNGYGADPRITDIVDHVNVYIVPVVNPDGYVYTWTSDRLWRKNRRRNNDGSYGVDLNRNWSVGWGGDGSSGRPGSEIYRGTAPLSEPETQALSTFMASLPNFAGHNDVHSYSQLILQPYGHTWLLPPDHGVLDALGAEMESAMEALHGKDYTHGPTYSTIYPASGVACDWTYDEGGALGFSFELRDEGQFGFLLPRNQIIPASEECAEGLIVLAESFVEQGGGMSLAVDPLFGGQDGRFTVSEAAPNEMAWLAYSLTGAGSTYVPVINVTLDLDRPTQAGAGQMTDANGNTSWLLPIPAVATGRTLWFQSVQFENKSNVVETVVN